MKFEDAVNEIRTLTDLRRVASAHVVDHNQLEDEEIRSAIIAAKPQYTDSSIIAANLAKALYQEPKKDMRVLARALLIDVLFDQFDFTLAFRASEEAVVAFEQSVVDASNETDISDLAGGDRSSSRYRDVETYSFVLGVAWENSETVSPDEVNLLHNLRSHLRISEWDHRLLEAKLGKYPKPGNESHTRGEINQARRSLQSMGLLSMGLLFPLRDENGEDIDLVPTEIAEEVRAQLGIEIRSEAYQALLSFWKVRLKANLKTVLDQADVPHSQYDGVDKLVSRVIANVPPSRAIASASPRFGLTSDELSAWCKQLSLSAAGPIDERVARVTAHFDGLRPRATGDGDERELWYSFFEELAIRDYDTLRAQHVIEKDLEIESQFEHATSYLFGQLLNHSPLKQSGSAHPDGLLSLRANYLMWDNKSKEKPGHVHLKDHISQFSGYMDASDKPVPIFLVIAPGFTADSEVDAVRYHSEHFDRNIVLITAGELKALAEEWSSPKTRIAKGRSRLN